MPISPQDHVHRLIRSMSGAEKRYFKLYSSRHLIAGHSNHLELFDAIAAMPVYNEQALRQRFAGAAFLRRFPITKRRLYEAVLESLDAFHAARSVDDRLHRALHHAELLHDRALYTDAAKVLHSARKLAQAHHRHAILLQLSEWERRLLERGNYAGTTETDLVHRSEEVAEILAAWREVEALWRLKSSSFLLLYRSGQAPGARESAALEELARSPLLAEGAPLHTPRGRFLHHHVRSALAYARNELHLCEEQLHACAEVLRSDPAFFQDEPDLLLGVMGNLAHVRMRLGKHQEALDGFREFRRIPLRMSAAPNPDMRRKLFVMGSSLELAVLCAKGDFRQALHSTGQLEAGLADQGDRMSPVRRAELALQAAYACSGAGEPEQALRWCNRLLNEPGIQQHQEVHALGRMLYLTVLVDLGKADLLAYVVRNTRRFLKQHGQAFAMEAALLDHAERLGRTNDGRQRLAHWAALAATLEQLAADPREAAVLDHIDLVSWAGGKAEQREFADVVKAKWQALKKDAPAKPRQGHPKRAA
jgi:hypothetical protein